MRIVHVTFKAHDVRAMKAALQAHREGHQVVLVMGETVDKRNVVLVGGTAWQGITVLRVNLRAGLNLLRRAVLALEPEIVHAHELDVAWALLAEITEDVAQARRWARALHELADPPRVVPLPVPLVYDQHEVEEDRPYQWARPLEREERCWKSRQIRAYGRVFDVLVSNTIQDARSVVASTVVHNLPPRVSDLWTREQARAHLCIPNTCKAIFFVGNPTPDRNLADLGRAAAELYSEGFRLYLLGQPPERDVFRLVSQVPGIQILGVAPYPWPWAVRPHMLDLLTAADVGFAGGDQQYANWRWGSPNKFWECARAGVPYVVSREVVGEDVPGWAAQYNGTVGDLVEKLRLQASLLAWPLNYSFEADGWPQLMDTYEAALAEGCQRSS